MPAVSVAMSVVVMARMVVMPMVVVTGMVVMPVVVMLRVIMPTVVVTGMTTVIVPVVVMIIVTVMIVTGVCMIARSVFVGMPLSHCDRPSPEVSGPSQGPVYRLTHRECRHVELAARRG